MEGARQEHRHVLYIYRRLLKSGTMLFVEGFRRSAVLRRLISSQLINHYHTR